MMRRDCISVLLGGVLLILLSLGWGTGAPELQAAGVEVPAIAGQTGGSAAVRGPAAALSPTPAYRYSAAGKADPFKPFMETDAAVKKKMEEEKKRLEALKARPFSPLQRADIGQFRLVGIAGSGKKRTAMVQDDSGKKYYPLFVGTYIGLNEGRVVEIRSDRVIVEEKKTGTAKKTQIRRVTVMLHKEEEGRP